MLTNLANASILVKDYDDAIRWYTEVLGLELRMDGSMGGDYRFVTAGVKGQNDVSIVLHKLVDGSPESPGVPPGVHTLLFHTDNCRQEIDRLRQHGVKITLGPEEQPWGLQAVFEDPYGNSHVLLEPSPMALGR